MLNECQIKLSLGLINKEMLLFIFTKSGSNQKRELSTSAPVAENKPCVTSVEEQKCIDRINAQGLKVRELKASGASKVVCCYILCSLLLPVL